MHRGGIAGKREPRAALGPPHHHGAHGVARAFQPERDRQAAGRGRLTRGAPATRSPARVQESVVTATASISTVPETRRAWLPG